MISGKPSPFRRSSKKIETTPFLYRFRSSRNMQDRIPHYHIIREPHRFPRRYLRQRSFSSSIAFIGQWSISYIRSTSRRKPGLPERVPPPPSWRADIRGFVYAWLQRAAKYRPDRPVTFASLLRRTAASPLRQATPLPKHEGKGRAASSFSQWF